MSRIANKPVELPSGVEAKLNGQSLALKGKNGELTLEVNEKVNILPPNVKRTVFL